MSTELPKAYNPAAVEPEAIRVWTEERAFHAEPHDPGNPYAIVIPPPNVTAPLHLGHALNNTIQDILTRWRRMAGDNAVWLPGTDHAGIATQTVVDKRLQSQGEPALKDYKLQETRGEGGREKFISKVQAWKDEYEKHITGQLQRMGCSCDWDRQAFTMDEPRAKAVREAFFRLFKDGLIYRGKRLVNWDPVTQTALADDEVEMEEIDGHFYYLKYPLTDGTGHVTVATTRPETMLGDTAVAINPKDPRAHELRGKHLRLPIVNREIPIVEDEYVVMPAKFGGDPSDVKAQMATGFLKVTPAHDPNDYEIGRRHNLGVINVMAPDASISDKHGWTDIGDAGFLLGKSREEARKLVVEWFKKHGLLEDVKDYKHSVGHSYRSHVPIEPYLSDQWYCKVEDAKLRGAALLAISDDQYEGSARARLTTEVGDEGRGEWEGKLKFYPARYAKTFQTWHENLRDWCISRQLWWGHRIPVWTAPAVNLGLQTFDGVVNDNVNEPQLVHLKLEGVNVPAWYYTQDGVDWCSFCVPLGHSEIERYLEENGFAQDPDVLDTWFSSGLWPLSTLNWPSESPELQKWNPSNVLTTAREIITLWVSRMVMFNLYFRDCLPFTEVFIHAMIQDGEGQKMSKTLGNGVDPLDIIESHGADAMRYTLAAMTTHTQDLRMPVDMVDPHSGETFTPKKITLPNGYVVAAPVQESPKDPSKKMVSSFGAISGQAKPTADMPVAKNTSSKFDEGRKFCNKIWQVALNFVIPNIAKIPPETVDESKWSIADRWIVSRLNRTVAEANEMLKAYRFDQFAKAIYDFFWNDFCGWYVEASKPALRDAARAGQTANILAAVLDASLRLLHPVMPFITETIWWKLNEARPQRGLTEQVKCPPSPRLIKAAWPITGPTSADAEATFAKLQEIVIAIRNVRNQYKVDVKKRVTVSINATGELLAQIDGASEMIELLAMSTMKDVRADLPAAEKASRVQAAGCEIYVEGLVDEAGEGARASKRIEELTKQEAALSGRLSKESYTAKAPPHLVQQTRDQLAEVQAELAKLRGT